MEFRLFTTVFFSDMETAPLARQVVTIMGSISGVRPTATEMANRKAATQSPLVMPLMKNTRGTMAIMNRISTQDTELTPLVKLVSGASWAMELAILPNRVWSPTPSTRPVADPEITLVPIKARLASSVTAFFSLSCTAWDTFSWGALSPVRADWLTNKSLASKIRRSAGTISPVDRNTRSPTVTSWRGISCFFAPPHGLPCRWW